MQQWRPSIALKNQLKKKKETRRKLWITLTIYPLPKIWAPLFKKKKKKGGHLLLHGNYALSPSVPTSHCPFSLLFPLNLIQPLEINFLCIPLQKVEWGRWEARFILAYLHDGVQGVAKSWTQLSYWKTAQWRKTFVTLGQEGCWE